MIGPIVFNGIILIIFIIFYFKNKKKGLESLKLAIKSCKRIAPLILIILIFIIFIQKFISTEYVINSIRQSSGIIGYFIAAFLGAFVHVPLFISFPLGGQLLRGGVNPGFIAVLITSLVMVHTFSIPLEIKELGLKFAAVRNILALVFAISIGIIMGVLY